MLKVNHALQEKVTIGGHISAKEIGHMRYRFNVENSKAIAEAAAEQAALKKKRTTTCHCGAWKAFQFRECATCFKKRRDQNT